MNKEELLRHLRCIREEARKELDECRKDGHQNSYAGGFESGYLNLSNQLIEAINEGEFDD